MSDVTYLQKVEEIEEVISKIGNQWECEFIDDMTTWDGEHTDKQKAVIDRLYEKACKSPY